MERVDELTLKILDGLATPAEEAEVTRLVEENVEARQRHLALVEVEAALRAGRLPGSVAEDALAQIRAKACTDLERDVMRKISALPTPGWATRPPATPSTHRRGARRWLPLAALAAAVVAAAMISLPFVWRVQPKAPLAAAVVLEISGSAEWNGETSESANLKSGYTFPVHRSLRLLDEESTIHLQYADGTRLNLIGPAEFVLALSPAGGKLVLLAGGGLKADVRPQATGQPMLVVTPHAEVRVLGTAFELLAGDDATRVDLEHGRIELVRNNETPVPVEPGSVATIPAGDGPIVVAPRPAIQATPIVELEFRDLEAVWFVGSDQAQPAQESLRGLTRWQAVYAFEDRLEAVAFSQLGKKGVMREAQAGSVVAFAEDRAYRTVLWDLNTRTEVAELDWRSQPRADESPVRFSVLAVSPLGDWGAVRRAGGKGHEYELHDLKNKTFRTLSGTQKCGAMAASPDGKMLAVGRRAISRSTGNFIELVNAATGEVRQTLAVERSHPIALAFSADGRRIAVGLTGEVQVWTTDTAEQITSIRLPGVPFSRVSLSANRLLAANGHQSETVWLWQIPAQPGQATELPTAQMNGQIRSLAFSPTGRLAVLNHQGRVSVWQVATSAVAELKESQP